MSVYDIATEEGKEAANLDDKEFEHRLERLELIVERNPELDLLALPVSSSSCRKNVATYNAIHCDSNRDRNDNRAAATHRIVRTKGKRGSERLTVDGRMLETTRRDSTFRLIVQRQRPDCEVAVSAPIESEIRNEGIELKNVREW